MVPIISAQSLITCGKDKGDGSYTFCYELRSAANSRSVMMSKQDDCAMFYQAVKVLKAHNIAAGYDLSEIMIYVDFSGIFDRDGAFPGTAEKQKIAESMFCPEGITIDNGRSYETYTAFERSASMSRECRLSFVNTRYYEELRERMTLGMSIGSCQLSKLYAYNGLLFTSGYRVASETLFDPSRIVIVDDPKTVIRDARIITVEDDSGDGSERKYRRTEKIADVEILEFDGEGLVSDKLARLLDLTARDEHIHSSFQIRMPYIKGVVHQVDFHSLFGELGIEHIVDLWGDRKNIGDIDLILTKSMFKGFGWFTENRLSWGEYLGRCHRYDHALYVSGVGKAGIQTQTKLNYQFLTTAAIGAEEFRPVDLPDGWERSPLEDSRQWITKTTETAYYDLSANEAYRRQYFLDVLDDPEVPKYSRPWLMASILRKNPRFIDEPLYTSELTSKAESILRDYSVGTLLVSGDNRYLSGDLMRFFSIMAERSGYIEAADILEKECLSGNEMYAPGAAYPESASYTLLRNPHIARNEEAIVSASDRIGPLCRKYLGHLSYVVMVDSRSLIPHRLGGADFDGDMVKTVADVQLNGCVERNHGQDYYPVLEIPSETPLIRDANDWRARFELIRATFSSRIGQICNAAFDRSVIAYDENADIADRERMRNETETLAILTGLEIDSAKSGIKPDLSEYLGANRASRSIFIKYKDILNAPRQGRFDDTRHKKLKRYFEDVDWSLITSNVERLPYLALMLRENTPKITPKKRADEELFAFAQVPGWKDRLDPTLMADVGRLIDDYDTAKNRIRRVRHTEKPEMKRRSDIERILFSRGQEQTVSADELYAVLSSVSLMRISQLRDALIECKWHLMPQGKREDLLETYLGSTTAYRYYYILTDFRRGGYRILWDIVSDLDEAYAYEQAERNGFTGEGDNENVRLLMRRAADEKDYADALRIACGDIIREKGLDGATVLQYAIALGKRGFAYDVLLPEVEKAVLTDETDQPKKRRRLFHW